MNKENIIKDENKSIAKVLVAPMNEEANEYALKVGTNLRENNINTEVFLEDKKFKAKLKYADKLCIPYVIVIGEDEIKNKKVTLKDMVSGEQETLKVEEAAKKIKSE